MDSENRRRRRIVVGGALAPFADGLRNELAGQGYAADTIVDHVHLLADLSGWLSDRGMVVADVTSVAAREFLAARHVAGHVPMALAGAVPAGRGQPRNLRRAARRDHVQAVLACCDRGSAVGRRDYAIVLMLARLALRGGEVARLELGEVNWRAGELTIRGKGGRVDVLPLPADVRA